MSDWYTFDSQETDTPGLLYYRDRIIENIRILKQFVPDTHRLRPHVKTNKCAEVCQLMQDAGIHQFKCATIAEAEMLGTIKAKDVLLAYQPLGPKIERLFDLMKAFPETRFSCLIDNEPVAQVIHQKALQRKVTMNVFIDLNIGMNRTGIAPNQALNLYRAIQNLNGLHFDGLHAYDGQLRDQNLEERTRQCNEGFRPVEELRIAIEKLAQSTISVIAGGTPSFPIHAKRAGVQCSPGTFILWDKGYQQLLPEQPFLFAGLVLTRIISLPAADIVTTDLGHKAIASENPLDKRVYFLNAPDLTPIGHSEEHLVLRAPAGHGYQVGDVLYGVPHHICPTVALHETATVVAENQVVGTWNIVSRKRKITI